MNKLSQKEIGTILYQYYLDNYCETDFSFDKGELRKEITNNYKNIVEKLSEEELEEIEENINVIDNEGTDYDSMNFTYSDCPELFLQITSMIDYDGNSPDGYSEDKMWADVGMFFVNYEDVEYDDLEDEEEMTLD